jgi:hypothetical protein
MQDLSPRAKKLLRDKYSKLWHEDYVVLGKGPAAQEIKNWCNEHGIDIGIGLQNNRLGKVSRAGVDSLEETLKAQFASIFTDFSQDTHQTAATKSNDEKIGKIKPTHHLLLVALTESNFIQAIGNKFYPSGQFNIELDINQLDLRVFDSLVVVENRDSFNDWHRYQVPQELTHALVVYRGDKHHSVACKRLLKLWRHLYPQKHRTFFGDYDLAGLRIALSGQYNALLLPEIKVLQKRLIAAHYPYNQEKYLRGLQASCPVGWKVILDLMLNAKAGLRQQWMYEYPLICYK